MALRNQPYLPLYIQDYMTSKARECSASTNGVYLWTMFLMHKSEEYGTIIFQKNDKKSEKNCKKNEENIENFAKKLKKYLPFSIGVIKKGLIELLEHKILFIENEKLIQPRMIKDNAISEARANAGQKGGNKSKDKNIDNNFATAKTEQNTENEYEYENEYKKLDIYCSPEIEKIFTIYSETCTDLCKLTFERKNREIREKIGEYLKATDCKLEYFKEVCIKANKLKVIAENNIDLKSILNNYIGIMNGKYEKKEEETTSREEDYTL